MREGGGGLTVGMVSVETARDGLRSRAPRRAEWAAARPTDRRMVVTQRTANGMPWHSAIADELLIDVVVVVVVVVAAATRASGEMRAEDDGLMVGRVMEGRGKIESQLTEVEPTRMNEPKSDIVAMLSFA